MEDCKAKYGKNAEILKNTELMIKNQQKEFNNLKSKLSTQIKENEKTKNDLKITLDHITNEILKYKSEIDKINYERNELQNIRNEYAQVLGRKFQDIITRRLKRGQCYHQPYFGCREFPAYFKLWDQAKIPTISETVDLGYMLMDMDYTQEGNICPMFYRAKMEKGVIDVRNVEVVM